MSEIKGISSFNQPLKDLSSTPDSKDGFELVLKEAIGKLQEIQSDAERAVKELVTDGDVVKAMLAMQKAELSFQMMIEVRNRLITAYEEIQRMQV